MTTLKLLTVYESYFLKEKQNLYGSVFKIMSEAVKDRKSAQNELKKLGYTLTCRLGDGAYAKVSLFRM